MRPVDQIDADLADWHSGIGGDDRTIVRLVDDLYAALAEVERLTDERKAAVYVRDALTARVSDLENELQNNHISFRSKEAALRRKVERLRSYTEGECR